MSKIMKTSKRLLIGPIIVTFIIICPILVSAGPVGLDGGNWELYKPDEIFPPSVPKLRAPVSEALPATVSGIRPLLVILLQASGDTPGLAHTPTFYSNLVTDPGGLNDYWTEVSYGNFNGYTPVTVAGWFASSWTRAQIAGSSEANAVIWGIQQADATFDFSTVDTNGDNNITPDELTIAVITTGVGADHGGTAVWSHHTSVGPVSVDGGARTVAGIYFITAEDNPMGTWAHELGHDLLLPDLYDTNGGSSGIGHYGLMGSGSWAGPTHPTAFEKSQLGWLTLTPVSTPQCVSIPDVETNAVAYKVTTGTPSQYFIVENRWRGTSFDSVNGWECNLPDEGLMITHIDETVYNANYDTNSVNAAEEHKAVDVEAQDFPTSHVVDADNLDQCETAGCSSAVLTCRGSPNNFWDSSGYGFSDTSVPCSAVLYDGTPSGVRILARSGPGATMQVCFFNAPPVANASGPYFAECAGTNTTISLDGTGSTDPEGAVLTYSWSTSCRGGSFNDSTAGQPTLTVNTSAACAMGCTVSLVVTDEQGLSSDTASATVTIQDTTVPVLDPLPGDITVQCDAVPPPASATATDICDPSVTPVFTEQRTDGSCASNYTLTRTWTATDDCGNTATQTQTVTVQDTTPPAIQCNAPSTIIPPDAPISFTVTATDNCSAPSVEIKSFDCTSKKGRSKLESCAVNIAGDTITILDSGGVGDNISWIVHATDACGHSSDQLCSVLVVNPGKKK